MILPIAYFPSIDYLRSLVGGCEVESRENFVKQTERNRCDILSDKGTQRLTVPIRWRHGAKIPLCEVEIDYTLPWQRNHIRTIRTCYASAPYFDHFFPHIEALLSRDDKYLIDLTHATTEKLLQLFKLPCDIVYTSEFRGVSSRTAEVDYEYYQVFSDKMDFVGNLSSLDLLFCEGRFIF